MDLKYWTREDSITAAIMASVIPVGIALAFVAEGPKVYAGIALALGLALIVGAFSWTILRARNAVNVEADEGGVRIRSRSKNEWIAYAKLSTVGSRTTFGRPTLQLDNRAFPLADGGSGEVAIISERVRAARRRAASSQGASLARGGRALPTWLSALDGSEGYRAVSLSIEELLAIALDRNADVEIRAAAIYKLLRGRDEEAKARVRDTIGRTMPPIVLLMISLAVRPGEWVPGLDEATDFLSLDDVATADRIKDARRVRVDAGEELAQEEALAEEQQRHAR